jgi:hypothetical protein
VPDRITWFNKTKQNFSYPPTQAHALSRTSVDI